MNQPTADEVLALIEKMPAEDRLALEKRLSERLDTQWDDAVAENRRIAQERGITEETIDRAIHQRRHGE